MRDNNKQNVGQGEPKTPKFPHASVISSRVQKFRSRLIKIPFFNFLNEVILALLADSASELSSSIAYYAMLSLFPLLLGVISVLGFFLPSANVQASVLQFVESNLPGATDVLRQSIPGIIQIRGPLAVFSVIGLFWSAGALFNAISRGVSRAFSAPHARPFLISRLRDFTMSLSACVFFYLAIIATAVSSFFGSKLGFFPRSGLRLGEFALIFVVFLLIYKTVPNIKTRWRHVWMGALFATVAFEIARVLIVFYFSRYSNVTLLYGTIASIIILMIFAYYAAFILLTGAEISAEFGRRRLGAGSRPRFPPDLCA